MKPRKILVVTALLAMLVAASHGQVEEQPSPSEKNPKAVELIKQAILLEDAMMLSSAVAKYQEVLKLVPNDFAAMNTIAGLYGKMEMPEQEVVWAKKAIDTNPKYFQAFINNGNGLATQGKFDEALKSYAEAAKLAPKSPLPIYSQGVVFENQRKFDDALALYKKSIDIDPKFEDGYFSAAAMYANLKQFKEAKALLEKLLELNPKAAVARQMLEQLNREKP